MKTKLRVNEWALFKVHCTQSKGNRREVRDRSKGGNGLEESEAHTGAQQRSTEHTDAQTAERGKQQLTFTGRPLQRKRERGMREGTVQIRTVHSGSVNGVPVWELSSEN